MTPSDGLPERAAQVLHFWFGEPVVTLDDLKKKMKRWYMGGPEMDRETEPFRSLVEEAFAGTLDDWAATPLGRLALVIVLDQFPRNLFRDSPRAFEGAAKAERLAIEAFDAGLDRTLSSEERNFFLMPLLHAEDLALQERCVALTEAHIAKAPPELLPVYEMTREQSRKYRDIIARFGRFPHRNEALGRVSTPQEVEFLRDFAEKMRPSGAKALEG